MITCFFSYPAGFETVPKINRATPPIKELTKEIKNIRKGLRKLPAKYHAVPFVRAIVIAALVVGITIGILALKGQLCAFPHQFTSAMCSLSPLGGGVGVASFTILTLGAALVIRRVKSLKNDVTGEGIGKLSGSAHWQEAYYKRERASRNYYPGYIDTSTLDSSKTGTALFYADKACIEHYYISSLIGATAPLDAVLAIAYHIVRIVVIPFYILACMARERINGKALYPEQRFFKWRDISKQWAHSLKQIGKAPFYAMAEIYAVLYSWLDPLNGRKLVAEIERDWNNGIQRSDGFWSVRGPQSADWRPEGGGGPEKLGRTGFYVAGCCTPMAVVYYENGRIVGAASMSKTLHPDRGRDYFFVTPDMFRDPHNRAVSSITRLMRRDVPASAGGF